MRSLHGDELVLSRSEADLLAVLERLFPGYVRVVVLPDIMIVMEVRACHIVAELTVADRLCLLAEIDAGLIKCNRVKRSKHSDIGDNRCIVFAMAVAVRRYIGDKAYMEARTSIADSLSIFRHTPSKHLRCIPVVIRNCIKRTGSDAAPAALAFIRVDKGALYILPVHDLILILDRIGSALPGTSLAPAAHILIHMRMPALVLLHLAGAAPASHADVLDGAAETGLLMTLKMGQRHDR